MFKYLACLGGITSRCRFTLLIVMAFMALTASSVLQAQEHGMSVTKGCNFNVRVCADDPNVPTDLDCQDEDLCLVPDCDESLPRDLICTFTATNADQFFDTLTIPVTSPTSGNPGAYDIVFNDGGPTVLSGAAISIIAVTGDALCAGGPALPCTVGAGIPGVSVPGAVQFEVIYTPTAADWDNTDGDVSNPLADEGHVISFDMCDGPDSVDGVNCTSVIESDDDGSTATGLVPGCLPPGETTCDDSNACTTEACNSGTGQCETTSTTTCDDSNACTTESCNTASGVCETTDTTTCDPDDDLCTEDFECDTDTGLCPPPGPPLICPPNGDGEICDLCDPGTGECIPEAPIPDVCQPPAARFKVTKDFTDDNPMEVKVNISCNGGDPLQSDSMIRDAIGPDGFVDFVVNYYTPGELTCEIWESPVPGGYNDTYEASELIEGSAASLSGGEDMCQFVEVIGGNFFCHITNTPNPGKLEVTKEWVVEGAAGNTLDFDAYIAVRSTGEIVDGKLCDDDWCTWLKYEGPATDTQTVMIHTDYLGRWVGLHEKTRRSDFEVDNNCGGGNSGSVRVYPEGFDGQPDIASCTFTNTIYFEGIPTLNQYGMAILALLMLGVGFIGFRRFV